MKNKNKFWCVIRQVMRENKILTGGMAVLILCSVFLALLPPLVLERIVNLLTESRKISFGAVILYFAALACAGLFETGQNVAITAFGQKITHGLRKKMSEKLSRLPAAYFTVNEPGKITSRFVNDVDAVDALFGNGVISMFADACKVLSVIAVIFWKSPGLGIMMLFLTPLLFALTRIFQKRMLKAQLKNRVAVEKVNNHIPETIRNIRMIHTLFREKYMERRYDEYIEESYRAMEKSNVYDSIYSPIIIFISSCVIAAMMILSAMGGGMQTFFGMSVGTAVAVIAYVDKVFTPLESIGMEIQNIQSAVAGMKRIEAFLSETEMQTVEDSEKDRSATEGEICFRDVSFSYQEGQQVLENLSFEVKTGECVTLMGRTGAGKSTILRLLLGLYEPDEGEIAVNGRLPQAVPAEEKRSLFGYVEQSFRLLDGSVAEQISLFDPGISQNQIEKAARLTGIHETILSLENGYDTKVTETMFSQGQFQLLSIARAIAAEPKILLLDEITANLDSDTEGRVMQALKNVCENRTVISVSHRLYEQNMGGRLIEI